jgi:cold shock CspA family protein
LHLRGGLNPALGLGLPGLTDAQGFGTESQQLIRTQQLVRNQQPSALDQLMAQNRSPDGLKPTMPSIKQLLPQNKSPDDLKPTVPSTEQLLAQVNANYAINSRASTGQPHNRFESATNLKALVGNDLVSNNQPLKPLGTASALNNLIQGSVQCFRHDSYGFISPADGSKDVFFHCNQINKADIKSHLIGGETVTFNKEFDSRRKKWYATNVTLSLPPKPPLEVGTSIPPTTSSNTGDKKKLKEKNYDGDDDDDDDGHSGDDENEIPSVESLTENRDKWGFLITAKRKSIKIDRENEKKKKTVVTMRQHLPKIPDDALSTIVKLLFP